MEKVKEGIYRIRNVVVEVKESEVVLLALDEDASIYTDLEMRHDRFFDLLEGLVLASADVMLRHVKSVNRDITRILRKMEAYKSSGNINEDSVLKWSIERMEEAVKRLAELREKYEELRNEIVDIARRIKEVKSRFLEVNQEVDRICKTV